MYPSFLVLVYTYRCKHVYIYAFRGKEMDKIKFIHYNQGFRSFEELDYIKIEISKTKITVKYGKEDLYITKVLKFDYDVINEFSMINVPKTDLDADIKMYDGFDETLMIDKIKITNAADEKNHVIPFKKQLKKITKRDLIEECYDLFTSISFRSY